MIIYNLKDNYIVLYISKVLIDLKEMKSKLRVEREYMIIIF